MRTTTALALLGAATCALANAEPEQIHRPVAVIARHVKAECEVDATADVEGRATPAPAVISDMGHDSESSWSEINTTVTVDARPWAGNTTSKHYRPLALRLKLTLPRHTCNAIVNRRGRYNRLGSGRSYRRCAPTTHEGLCRRLARLLHYEPGDAVMETTVDIAFTSGYASAQEARQPWRAVMRTR